MRFNDDVQISRCKFTSSHLFLIHHLYEYMKRLILKCWKVYNLILKLKPFVGEFMNYECVWKNFMIWFWLIFHALRFCFNRLKLHFYENSFQINIPNWSQISNETSKFFSEPQRKCQWSIHRQLNDRNKIHITKHMSVLKNRIEINSKISTKN